MASRSEQTKQDQASEQRRLDAIGHLITATEIPEDAGLGTAKGVATDVLSALIKAIEDEAVDVRELRRKGWQSAAKVLDETVIVVRGWRDLLVEYTPPAPIKAPPEPAPIIPRSAVPDAQGRDLEQRLVDAFGPQLAPIRHIRTVIEQPATDNGDGTGTYGPTYGPLCGSDRGSFTHPGGANCTTCHAIYAEQNGGEPYSGPVAHGNTVPALTELEQNEARDLTPEESATVEARLRGPARRDEPITPTVAREIREEIEAENATILGVPVVTDPRMPNDTVAVVSPEDAAVFKVGDTVTVGGIEFTKIGENPFETIRREAVEQFTTALDERVARERALGIDAGGAALQAFVTPPFVDPAPVSRRPARERMTAAQVREHGLARSRGARHRSVSQVTGYSECGTRYALSDLEVPAWWNVGGKAFHACAEEINRYAAHAGNTAAGWDTEALWLRNFDAQIAEQQAATPDYPPDMWRAANKGSEHFDWWRVEGPPMVRRYVVWLQSMLQEGWRIATVPSRSGLAMAGPIVPVIEYETYLDVGTPTPDLSIIDLALTDDAGRVLIPDFKAGNSAPKDTFQLGVYGWAALAAGIAQGPKQIRGAYYRARKGEMTPPLPVLDMHPWPDVVQRFRDQDVMERQGVYLPNVTTFCGGCGVRDLCPAQAS